MLMQKFGVVQAPRTSSNLLEPQQHRVSKVWRGLSQAFGVGRLYRTFSIYSVTGETRSAGCLSTSSGWEPLRTSSNLHEPQHHRENKVWRGLSPAFGVVRLYRTFSFYSIAGETRCAGCLGNSSGWFKHSEPQRTYSNHPHRTYTNHNITERARCGEVCHMRSGWFDCTEPSLSTALQGKQGVQGAYALGRGGSSTANLSEPTRTTAS